MKKYEGFKKAGSFVVNSGKEVQGELTLGGASTTLNIYSEVPLDTLEITDISGHFLDQSRVSLIDCVPISNSATKKRDGKYSHSSRIFPHFAVFGDQDINSHDSVVKYLSFTVDDASILFHDYEAFGSINNARPHMERISKGEGVNGKFEIGEYPLIFYFTGKYELFAADTVHGRVSVTHGLSYKPPGPEGIHVKNTIKINISFSSDVRFTEAIKSVTDLLQFLEIIAGRPQNILKLVILPGGVEGRTKFHDVYWCMPPRRNTNEESSKSDPADLPIQAALKPNEFSVILKAWLERQATWRSARSMYSTAVAFQRMYTSDRIISAANMFDVMPSSACPDAITVSSDLDNAANAARNAFQNLPDSPERNSILGALGRIGKASLKRKVRGRIKLITDIVGDQFPELDMVADKAIDCRNYYVHGSPSKIDFTENFDQVTFFTDTLEFIFSASDLIESGWDVLAWSKRGSTLSHPFGRYRINYLDNLKQLKMLF